MVSEKIRQIVRQFGENGLKLLLENPLNFVDLLRLGAPDIVPMIEPGQLTTVQTTFVQSDYRHVTPAPSAGTHRAGWSTWWIWASSSRA